MQRGKAPPGDKYNYSIVNPLKGLGKGLLKVNVKPPGSAEIKC